MQIPLAAVIAHPSAGSPVRLSVRRPGENDSGCEMDGWMEDGASNCGPVDRLTDRERVTPRERASRARKSRRCLRGSSPIVIMRDTRNPARPRLVIELACLPSRPRRARPLMKYSNFSSKFPQSVIRICAANTAVVQSEGEAEELEATTDLPFPLHDFKHS